MTFINLIQEKHYVTIVCLPLNVFDKYKIFCKRLDVGLVGINQPHTTGLINSAIWWCVSTKVLTPWQWFSHIQGSPFRKNSLAVRGIQSTIAQINISLGSVGFCSVWPVSSLKSQRNFSFCLTSLIRGQWYMGQLVSVEYCKSITNS